MCDYICTEVYNWLLQMDIFDIGFIFIRLNKTYVISKFCCTHFQCDCSICTTLRYLKWSHTWGFVFNHIFIIDHYFITNFLVVVYYFSIFANVVFICLCLSFMIYSLPIHFMFNQDNHITAKYQLDRTITFFPIACWEKYKFCCS